MTATVSTPSRATASGTLVSEPTTGTEDRRVVARGHARADDLETGVRLALELGDQRVDLLAAAHGEHPVRPVAGPAAGPVQDLAGGPAAEQQQERAGHERDGEQEPGSWNWVM